MSGRRGKTPRPRTGAGLSREQLGELRDDLLRALARLERSLSSTERSVEPVELDQTAFGRLSRIDALQSQSLARNLQDRELGRYAAVVGALARMDDGSYGLCGGCREPIGYGRLTVFPEAEHCLQCGAE